MLENLLHAPVMLLLSVGLAASSTGVAASLASFPAGGSNQFTLSVSECKNNACPIVVELQSASGSAGSAEVRFPLSAAAGESKAQEEPAASIVSGARPARNARRWTWGEEENAVSLSAQPLRLSATHAGLLVQEDVGFEHVQHWKAIFADVGSKLELVWESEPAQGPAWVEIHPLTDTNGAANFAVFSGTILGTEAGPDELQIAFKHWNSRAPLLEDAKQPPAGFRPALAAKAANSLGQAREWQHRGGDCLANTLVLPGTSMAGGKAGLFYVARVATTWTRARAEQTALNARSCLGQLSSYGVSSGSFLLYRLTSPGG